jgi:hypothetical protein
MRASVVHPLMVLALIPTVSLPVFSWLFIQDRLRVSADAGRIEDGLVDVRRLDRLREAIRLEAEAQVQQGVKVTYRLTPAQRAAMRSDEPDESLEDRLNATNSALV